MKFKLSEMKNTEIKDLEIKYLIILSLPLALYMLSAFVTIINNINPLIMGIIKGIIIASFYFVLIYKVLGEHKKLKGILSAVIIILLPIFIIPNAMIYISENINSYLYLILVSIMSITTILMIIISGMSFFGLIKKIIQK